MPISFVSNPSTPRDELLAHIINEAAREATPWAPASGKVFISDVYDRIVAAGRDGGAPIEEFKDILVDLNRRGIVELSRADLVAAMPFDKVQRSETDGRGATFHFIVRDRKNPPDDLVENPAWVTNALADSYEVLEKKVPPQWMPEIARVSGSRNRISGTLVEYGCGAYGCVIPTLDPATVLKVTTDTSEAEFAAQFANELVVPVCVEYRMVVELSAVHQGAPIHLLWRESAEHVGEIDKIVGPDAERLVHMQHRAGTQAYLAVATGKSASEISKRVARWLERCEDMARGRVPELRHLGRGMIEIYERQGIVFGDVHGGNLGLVERNGEKVWLVTDPGNMVVLQPDG